MSTADKTQEKLKTKGKASGSPRYSKGIFPAYDKEYRRLANRSNILSDPDRRDLKNAFAGTGIGECKRDLIQLVGNDDGFYKEEGTAFKALIPAAKNNLQDVHKDFKRWQKQQVREGHALTPPEEWPEALRTERLKAEARLDVRRAEKHVLEERIKELKKRQGKAKQREILPNGPMGRGLGSRNSHDRRIQSTDGQRVSFKDGEIPYIDEEDSPYHLMPLATYRQMSKAWKKKHRIRRMDIVRRSNAFAEKLDEKGLEKPPMWTSKKFEAMIKGEAKYKGQDEWPDFEEWPDNPDWPEDAKKITEI